MYTNSDINQTCHWWRFQTGPNNLSSDTLFPRPFGDRVTNMFAQLLFYKHIIVISPKENYTHSLSGHPDFTVTCPSAFDKVHVIDCTVINLLCNNAALLNEHNS